MALRQLVLRAQRERAAEGRRWKATQHHDAPRPDEEVTYPGALGNASMYHSTALHRHHLVAQFSECRAAEQRPLAHGRSAASHGSRTGGRHFPSVPFPLVRPHTAARFC